MSIEALTIDERNQVLQGLIIPSGEVCGKEVLHQFLQSKLTILIGEPASGKSTLAAQLIDEAKRRRIRTHQVKYDNALVAYSQQFHSREEGEAFNRMLTLLVRTALRESDPEDKVLLDTVSVGNRYPKDRSITAVDQVVIPESDQESFQSYVLGLIATPRDQFHHSFIRQDILKSFAEHVLHVLKENHNISVENVPHWVSTEQMGEFIQMAIRNMATQLHVAQIGREVIGQGLQLVRRKGVQVTNSLDMPYHLLPAGQIAVQLKVLAMQERQKEIPLPEEAKGIALNLNNGRCITWYADDFLPDTIQRRDIPTIDT